MTKPLKKLIRQIPLDALAELDEAERARLLAELDDGSFPVPALARFVPHPQQQAVIASGKRVRVVLGGNRTGKTHLGAALSIAHALGYRPWEVPGLTLVPRTVEFKKVQRGALSLGDAAARFSFPPRNQVPESAWVRLSSGAPIPVPNVGVIVSGQGARVGLGAVIHSKFRELWPREASLAVWSLAGGVPVRMLFDNGSEVYLLTSEQAPAVFEGWAAAWAWVDEPIPQSHVTALWRGLTDLNGNLLFTMTPIGPDARWLYDEFVAAPRDDVAVFRFTLDDNPYLDDAGKAAFRSISIWSDAERAARLEGRFEFFEDRVFPTFQREVHVVDDFEVPPGWEHICAIDPHTKRPWYVLWLAVSPDRERYVALREWPEVDFAAQTSSNYCVKDYVDLLRDIEERERFHVVYRILDPLFGSTPLLVSSTTRKTSLTEELAAHDLPVVLPKVTLIQDGIQRIRDLLAHDSAAGIEPALRITARCRNLIASLDRISFKVGSEAREVLVLKYKDPIDALRYAVMYRLPPQLPCSRYLDFSEEENFE